MDEIAPQLPQLLLSGESPEQLGLGLLALRDVETDDEHVRFAIDLDDIGRLHNRMNRSSPASKLAFHLSQRTVAFKIREELLTVFGINPYAKLRRIMTHNSIPAQAEPSDKRIICLDEPLVAQSQDRDVHRAGVKGFAEAFLALPQQMLFQGERNHRREGRNEIDFLGRPVARWANMLVTKDANNLAAHPNRSIEHGRNAKRFKVVFLQASRGRVRQHIARNDRSFGSYRIKISWAVNGDKPGATEPLITTIQIAQMKDFTLNCRIIFLQ